MQKNKQRGIKIGVTIDGPTSRDLDDGFWLFENKRNYRLEVSISDASVMVSPFKNHHLYQQAYQQVETLYLADSNEPMLPRNLSENALSLLPGLSRPAITFTLIIRKEDLQVVDVIIERTRFKNLKKLSYEYVDSLIFSKKRYTKIGEMLAISNVLAQALFQKRRDKGALTTYDLEKLWRTNEEGRFRKLPREDAYHSYLIIQEFMILTNATVTEFLLRKKVPVIVRNHEPLPTALPRKKILAEMLQLSLYGHQHEASTLKKEFNLGIDRAEYATELKGHYGLNLNAYGHWTSPIRRFADLVNHVILNAWIDQKKHPYTLSELQEMCVHINNMKEQHREQEQERAAKKDLLNV